MGINIKPGDTVYVIATCADALHRASGTCWFYEVGGCPFRESGRLEYCGERENVRDVFESVIDYVNYQYQRICVRWFDFRQFDENVPFRIIRNRVFTNRADAVEALERMERERERKRQERRERAKLIEGQCGMFTEV